MKKRRLVVSTILILSFLVAAYQIYGFGLDATFPQDNFNYKMWQGAGPLFFSYSIGAPQPAGQPNINCSLYANFSGNFAVIPFGPPGGPYQTHLIAGNYAYPPGIGGDMSQYQPGNYKWSISCYNSSESNATVNRTLTLQMDQGMNTNFSSGGEDFRFSPGPPTPIGADRSDVNTVNDYVDLKGMALKELPMFLMFVVMVKGDRVGNVWTGAFPNENDINFITPMANYNATHKSPYCTQNASSPGDAQFYIYIDIDGNESNGCNVTQNTEVNTTGYDVAIYFNQTVVGTSPEFRVCNSTLLGDFDSPENYNTSSGVVSISTMETCSQQGGLGILHMLLNATKIEQLSGRKKAQINNSMAINASQVKKVGFYVKSGNGSGIQDSFSAKVYYTPGSMDFVPFDPGKCIEPTYNVSHPECFMFGPGQCPGGICFGPGQGFFNDTYFDNCFAQTGPNCGNPNCYFIPECRGQINDSIAPTVRFTNVIEFADRAFIDWSTNEPSIVNVSFYGTDSDCRTLNKSLGETLPPFMNPAYLPPDWDYKPFHHIELFPDTLGFSLTADTLYYFKTTSKDKSNNSAISNCLSFTTNSTKSFGAPKNINITMPPQGINFQFDDGSGAFQPFVSGNYTNKTDQRLKFAPPDASWQIVIPGVDFSSDIGVDLSNAFTSNATTGMVGMSSNSWLELVQKLTTDSIDITIPSTGDILRKCNDSGGGCSDVTSMATLISSGGGQTTWRIPVSLGFSTYTVNSSTTGFNMTTDRVTYQSYPLVSAYMNFTNLNTSITDLQNVTINNSASASGVTFTVEYYNSSDWITGSPATIFQNVNVSNPTKLQFRFNISMSTATQGRWNFSITVSNASSTELNKDFPTVNTRPYLDSINLTSPASGSITFDNLPDFYFIYKTESGGTLQNCSLYVGGTYYTSNASTVNSTQTKLTAGEVISDGPTTWLITCFNDDTLVRGELGTSQSFTITIDTLTPGIDFAGGTESNAANKSQNWIYINVSIPTEPNVFNVTFYLYNSSGLVQGPNVTGSANRVFNYTGLADGLYYYNVTVNDTVEHTNSTSTRSIRLDTAAPSVTITAPSANQYVKGTATLTATVTDTNSVASVYFNVSNGTLYLTYNALASGNTWSNTTLVTTLLSDGLHNVTVYATDLVSKLNSSEVRNFSVDNTYPTLTLNYPADGANITISSVNFTWTPTDAVDTNVSCNLTLDSIVNQSWMQSNNGTPFNQTIWSILDGFHSWSVSCWDNATNVNTSSTRSLTIETTNPVAAMTSPSNSSILTDSYFNMTLQVNESNPAATLCTYNLSNPSTVLSGSILNSSFTLSGATHTNVTKVGLSTGLLNGTYNLSITCSDMIPNNVTVNYNLTVLDNTTPTVNAIGISTSGTGTATVSIVLSVNTSEYVTCKWSTSDVAYASMGSMDSTNSITHTNTESYTSDESGTYYVRCIDRNSNTMTSSSSAAYSADVTTTTGGGTSGGGGGATSGASASPVITRSWSTLGVGTTSFQVLSSAIDLTDVVFTLSKSATSPAITVSKVESASVIAPALTTQVYQYMQITKTNLNDTTLSNIVLKFKVPKSWLFDKGISSDSIILKRYTTVWIDLTTTKVREDAAYVYYEATSSGLSYFAISTRQAITPPTTPSTNVTPPTEQPPAEQPPAEQPTAEQLPVEAPPAANAGVPAWQFVVILLVIIIIGVGAYLFYNQQKEKSPPQQKEIKKK